MEQALTKADQHELASCEDDIRRGMDQYFIVGKALWVIREKRLFREQYGTFEQYCLDRWEMGRRWSNTLIQHADIVTKLTNGSARSQTEPKLTPKNTVPLPTPSHSRILAAMEEGEQVETWNEAVEKNDGQRPSVDDFKAEVGRKAGKHREERFKSMRALVGKFIRLNVKVAGEYSSKRQKDIDRLLGEIQNHVDEWEAEWMGRD